MSSGGTTTRTAILAAAREEIDASGSLTIQAVAARAGVSRQAIHYHFGGAGGLRTALAEAGIDTGAIDMPTRERLLEAAERVLSRPDGGLATMEAIAAEARLTKGAVYHHFADRAELLTAVARRVSPVGDLVAALEGARDLPIRAALLALAEAYFEAMLARADIVRQLAANAARDPELSDILMGEIIGKGAPVVFAWFRERTATGELRVADPSLAMQALVGPIFLRIVLGSAVFGRLQALGITAAASRPDAYIDLLLDGMAGPNAVRHDPAGSLEGAR